MGNKVLSPIVIALLKRVKKWGLISHRIYYKKTTLYPIDDVPAYEELKYKDFLKVRATGLIAFTVHKQGVDWYEMTQAGYDFLAGLEEQLEEEELAETL